MEDYDERHLWRYVIPYLDKSDVSTIRSYIDNNVYAMPFHRNPFKVGNEIMKQFKVVLTD